MTNKCKSVFSQPVRIAARPPHCIQRATPYAEFISKSTSARMMVLMSGHVRPVKLQLSPSKARSVKCRSQVPKNASNPKTFMKICGITTPEDAQLATQAGASLVGMIMWPKAKRSVSDDVAAQIADAAKRGGATPVGVFVDEDAATIQERCTRAGIPVAQLHGDGARASLGSLQGLEVVYVMHSQPDGTIVTPLPAQPVDWVLIDGLQGGSGQALDWSALTVPEGVARRGWLLAGGLKPENVAQAISLTQPTGVDVSSGVCLPDGLRKDPAKVTAFSAAVSGGTT